MDITLQGVTKRFGTHETALEVFSEVNATFAEGKSYAIQGPSGIGKSTLLHLIGRLDNVSSGSILIGQTDVCALSEEEASLFRRRHIGMIFQFHHLLPEFSARENIMMPLLIRGVEEGLAGDEADRMLERVGMVDRSLHRPTQLSGGEQQRIAIARAVVGQPEILLADEPTGNLDPQNAESISALLCELAAEAGGTLLVVTHSPSLAEQMDVRFEMGSSAGGARLRARQS
ncbi:ABC transporter ATP-binding protein [bacterium]|nr:ABC transporter ATP-binding protein [bacterium]